MTTRRSYSPAGGMRSGDDLLRGRTQTDPDDAAIAGLEDRVLEESGGEGLSALRKMPELGEDVSGEGLEAAVLRQFRSDFAVDLRDVQAGVDLDPPVGETPDRVQSGLVELVLDVTDDLPDDVAESDESGRPAVFVQHDRELDLLAAELRQEFGEQFRSGA